MRSTSCCRTFASGASLIPNNFRRPLSRIAGLCLFLLFAGCASRPVVDLPPLDDWETRQQVLAAVEEWEFTGRVAVSAGDDGFNGKLRWTQQGEAFRATVSGPLGIGTVRMEGDENSVILTDKDGERTELRDVEQDLRYRYGWTIPVRSLRYWALGIPDPASNAQTELNASNQLARLEQDGWSLAIGKYRPGSGSSMPSTLTASKSDMRVRIVIDKWKFFD